MKPTLKIVAKANEAEIFLYDQIGASFWGDGISSKQFADELRAVGKVGRIVVRINSPGGDVFDGAAIYDLLVQSEIPVDVIVDGLAASAAFTVAMAGRTISIGEAGTMMLHNAKAMVGGDAADMRQMADVVDKISTRMGEIYAKRCKMSLSEVKRMMDDETWMTAEECVQHGFADKVIASEGDPAAEVAARFDLSQFKHVPESLKQRAAVFANARSAADMPKKTEKSATDLCDCPCAECIGGDCPECTHAMCACSNCTDCPEKAKMAQKTKVPGSKEPEKTANAEKEQVMEKKETTSTAAAVEVREENYGPVAAQIVKLGRDFGVGVDELIEKEASLAVAKEVVADVVLARAKQRSTSAGIAEPTVSQMTEKEQKDYSLVRAIRFLVGENGAEARLECEVSQAIAKDIGRQPRGLFIPTRIRAAGLDTKTNAAGKYTVATEVRDLIELLRNKARVIQLGGTVLSGLNGNLQFPTQLTGSSGSWVAENPGSDVSASDATFGVRTLSPKTYQATTSFSRQVLAQSTIDIEDLVRNDLATAHALAVDAAAINGLGSSNQPQGLLKVTGIGDVAIGAAGGAPTYEHIVDLETKIADANADEAGMKFLTTPIMRGKLKKTTILSNTVAQTVWQQVANSPGVGDLIGYPAYVSKQVPATLVKTTSSDCHAIIFGYWPSLYIGEWGVIEVVVDPYALKKQGMIEVTSFQMVDIMLRQPAQFAAIQDSRNV